MKRKWYPCPPPSCPSFLDDRAKRPSVTSASSRRLCISCDENKSSKDFIYPSRSCIGRHTPNTCTACLRTWIQSSLQTGSTVVTCPECPERVGYFTIREVADSVTFDRYQTSVLVDLLNTEETFVWCAHRCGSGQFHPAGHAEPIFTCHHCGLKTCVLHQLPWHTDYTCGHFDRLREEQEEQQSLADRNTQALLMRAREENASRRFVRRNTKACPQCHSHIEKNGGCDHMTCRQCRHEFCWGCLAPYSEIWRQGNERHKRHCLHYR